MTPERWQQIEAVLQAALDRPTQERASFIDEACDGDANLKDEATSLINAHEEAGEFIEQAAITQDARVLIGHDPDNIGDRIAAYTIIERLGGGGMGEVYLAQDSRLNRRVALKILPAYFAADDARLRRFQTEANAASALNHPNILTIYEVGEDDGIYYIATEFIEGMTIRELMAKRLLSGAEILDIAEQVASALSAAHSAGIIHRDIKPENIMRRPDGLVKILDFGIAKLLEHKTQYGPQDSQRNARVQTEVGVVMGTVGYMSPEQARGLTVDERTDIWSLGVVLYEMLASRLPFEAATRMDSIVAILERDPPSLSRSGDADLQPYQVIVDKALRKDRSERYQAADELLADLKRLKTLPSISRPSESTIGQARFHPSASRPRVLALGIVLLLVAVAAAGIYWRRFTAGQTNVLSTPAEAGKTYVEMSEAEQLAFISEQEQRISTMMSDRHVKLNDEALRAIKLYVDRYVAHDSKPGELAEESLSAVYGRAPQYVPLIARSFAARRVPVIIGIYLPVIESAYRNCFENSIGAKGLFQFLPQTARQYGVSQDEMCDVEKMTPAAAHYLADRMAELGEDSESLTLVLLSYNRGPEWVRNTLREFRGTENYQRNFWTLFTHRDKLDATFRNENAGYVPAFFAAAIIGENPQRFDLPGPPLSRLAE